MGAAFGATGAWTCGGSGGGGTCGGGGGGGVCGGGGGGGGGACGGGGGGGATGLGGGGGGGGAGLAGGAAVGGVGFAGAPFGGALGLPSGPTSVAACATTSGAVCACDEEAAKCIAVRAVVASSTRRRFVMMVWVPGKFLTTRSGDQRISVRPDCGGLQRRTCFYFCRRKVLTRPCSLRIQTIVSNRTFTLSPARNLVCPD